METTTARLRKTFQFPTDNDSDDSLPEAMDEQEQESLIRTMQAQNNLRNKQYKTGLFFISILTIVPYLPTLFSPPATLLSLLSISSLLSTAYLLYVLPSNITGFSFLDKLNVPAGPPSRAAKQLAFQQAGEGGPMEVYLPWLNLGLCVVLVGLGSMMQRKGETLWWGFGWLPIGVYTVTVVAKWVMGGVDPEGELGALRYEFKGA